MATPINNILEWFKTGKKPTQAQFWATWESFWHKNEQLPQSSILNLSEALNDKANQLQLDDHLADSNAHELSEKLAGKSDLEHTHTIDEVVNLQDQLNNFDTKQTDFSEQLSNLLKGEINLPAFPASRNDGQLPTNKVLSVDALGNLKLFTIASLPAPFLKELIPDSYLPNNTGDFLLKGSFFTPDMLVSVQGQQVNYITFISDNEIRVNITTGATEGLFDVTLNNGIIKVFPKVLLIVLGEVFKPNMTSWTNKIGVPDISVEGELSITVMAANAGGRYNMPFNITKNFAVKCNVRISPLGVINNNEGYQFPQIKLVTNDDILKFAFAPLGKVPGENIIMSYSSETGWNQNLLGYSVCTTDEQQRSFFENIDLEWRFIDNAMHLYANNTLKRSYPEVLTENLFLSIDTRWCDIVNIKYIELNN